MLDKIRDYFEMEYIDACIACEYKYTTPKEVVNNALQRCLGVTLFVQGASYIPFEEIDSLYTEYRRKLEELENVR